MAAGSAIICIGVLLLGAAIATFVTFSANSGTGDRKLYIPLGGVTKSEMEELINKKLEALKDNTTAVQGLYLLSD